ncbi:hypothetical protein AGLY_011413 [Aphis glycines]|uniref:Uncharacterized protein n=1 Tax=Aphis glycines TaxID=307491 RepID=A0A6G0TFI5_APHGL|nr:hypothetical protein AGLY_011413 [Aphis glycines]
MYVRACRINVCVYKSLRIICIPISHYTLTQLSVIPTVYIDTIIGLLILFKLNSVKAIKKKFVKYIQQLFNLYRAIHQLEHAIEIFNEYSKKDFHIANVLMFCKMTINRKWITHYQNNQPSTAVKILIAYYSRAVTGDSDGKIGGKSSTHPDPKNLLSNTCNNCKAVSRTEDRGQPVFIMLNITPSA